MRINISEKELTAASVAVPNSPAARVPGYSLTINIPWWARWLLSVVAEPIIRTIFEAIRGQIPRVVDWIWRVAEQAAAMNLPISTREAVTQALLKWLTEVEEDIISQL